MTQPSHFKRNKVTNMVRNKDKQTVLSNKPRPIPRREECESWTTFLYFFGSNMGENLVK